jgi:hypothetical protein
VKRLTSCARTALVLLLVGCYTLEPTGGVAPAPGLAVAMDINDQGRVGLGGQMGPEIAQIEGRLVAQQGDEYLIAVTTVRLLRGGEQVWRGEQVRVKSSYVSTMYERRFSKTRTAIVAGVGIGALAAIFGQKILGGGAQNPDPMLPDTSNAVRIPRP